MGENKVTEIFSYTCDPDSFMYRCIRRIDADVY